jgi:RHS repeat-associated protein
MWTNKMRQLMVGLNRLVRGACAGLALCAPRALSWLLLFVMVAHGLNVPFAAATGARPAEPKSTAVRAARAAQVVETFNVFGPRRFDRTSGAPTTVTDTFALPADAGAPFKVQLQNGAADGAGRVSSATVKLNGADVFKQSDFSQQTASLTRNVTLAASNTIEVKLTSAAGSHVTVVITATRTQAPPASLASVNPARATQGQSLSVTLTGSNTHWAAGQTRAALGEEISVGGAAPGELGLVTVTGPTTAVAEIAVSPTAALAPRNARVVTAMGAGAGDESVSLVNALTVVAPSAPGSSASNVSTLAGAAGSAGYADGAAAQSRFNSPGGLAVGPDDAVYVADTGNNRIRVVRGLSDPAGAVSYSVSTLAGTGAAGYADGPAGAAQFEGPQGVAVDAAGVVYVADTGNHRVRRIGTDGLVTTLAGDGTPGLVNGAAAQARFNAPRGIAVDKFGNVYVADSGNSSVRRVSPSGEVTTVAGDGTVGTADGAAARFDNLSGIACDGEHVFVYLGDTGNHRIRRLDSTNTVITLAGAERGFADGSAVQARFAEPSGLALDGAGKIVLADAVNSLVRMVDAELAAGGSPLAVTTLAGAGERGGADGPGNVATFHTPRGVAVSQSSAVLVADTGNNTIRRVLLPPVIAALTPQRARAGQQIGIFGERFDGRAPERNTVRFTRTAAAGGGQTTARVLGASRTALTVEVPADATDGPVTVQTEGGTATSPVDFQFESFPLPVINDFDPKRGTSGTAVTLTGAGLKADAGSDPAVTFEGASGARLPALVTSSSSTQVRVLVPNAALTGKIELSHAGGTAATASPFVVDSEQDFQLTVSPSTASAVQGGTGVYVVSVTSDRPDFSQMAKLTAAGLPQGVVATFEPEQITAGATSTLSISLGSSGLAPGSYQFGIEAAAEADGRELKRNVGATLNVLAAGQTTLVGRVLSTDSEPIMGAIVSLDGRTATTDAAGSFMLSGVLAGQARPLMVDGRTASAPNRTYPVIVEPADITAGQANVIPYNYYLPPIDTQYEVERVPGQTAVAANPTVPGLSMTIPAEARLINRDGTPVTRVSITPLPIDRTPTPLPTNVVTSLVYTSQPGGAVTDIAIPVVYPNLAGADPGTRVELYSFDHDLVRWKIYGWGRVSADGRTISPEVDPTTGRLYGLPDFSWHFPNAGPGGNPGGDGGKDKDCSESSSGDNPVNYATGMKMEEDTDIAFGGARGGLELTRIYTSDLGNSCTSCPFGRGTTHNYAVRLSGSFGPGGAGRLIRPGEDSGRLFNYAGVDSTGAHVFTSTATAGLLGDVLRRLPAGNFEYRKADGSLMRFDSSGRLTAEVDRNGNTTTLEYTGANLTRVTDAVGRSITLEYDLSNRITRATDPLSRVTRYGYDGSSNLSSVTDPLGNVTRHGYAIGGRLASVTDPRGVVVKQITYDGNGRVIRQRFADGGVETYAYVLSGGLVTTTTITDPLGRKTVKRFNAAGYVVEVTDPLGQTSKFSRDVTSNLATSTTGPCGCNEGARKFDSRGNTVEQTDRAGQTQKREYDPNFPLVTKVTDELGRVTSFAYDTRGNLVSATNALGQTTTTGFDGFGQMTSVTNALGQTTRTEYDAYGNISASVDPLGNRTTFEYDVVGRLLSKTDPLGRRQSYTYDAGDRMRTLTDTGGAVSRYEYDASGNMTKATDALNRVWKLGFDSLGRHTTYTDPLGRVLRRTYSLNGEVTAVAVPSGRTVRYNYDARGSVASAVTTGGEVVRYAYDNKGHVTSITNPRGGTTTYRYDELYRLTGVRDPLGQNTTVVYNALGQPTESYDEVGRRTTYTYDGLNRLASMGTPDATVSYTYDAAGRPVRLEDSQGGAVAWAYDEAGRLRTETSPAGVVAYTYNAAGQRVSMSAADRAQVTYEYDEAGRVKTIRQGVASFGYSYDSVSRLVGLTRPNAVTTGYTYDAGGRIERLRHEGGAGQPIEDYRYTYTTDDQIASITSQFSATQLPNAKTAAAADAANRVGQFGASSYAFDELGQTVSKTDAGGTTRYDWDARGRLTQATLADGRVVRYGYDALGRLAARTAGGSTTRHLYDGEDVVLDRRDDGSTVEYVNGGTDRKLSQTAGGGAPLYFLQDHLGSTAALTDAGGSVVEARSYTAYGETGGASATRYGFTGRELDDATGLLNYRARWYDPEQGRFLSPDPIGFAGGINFYAYTGGDPLNLTDPSGLSAKTFFEGFVEGAAISFLEALAYTALLAVLTCLTAGTALAVLPTILAAYMAAEAAVALAEEIDSLLNSDMCPDDLHYRVGLLIGSAIGGALGGKLGGKIKACFAAGTLVQTAEGEKPIEEVEAGDRVLAADPEAGEAPRWREVTRTFERASTAILRVRVGSETLSVTPEHPFWVAGKGWTPAGELRAGTLLVGKDGAPVRVDAVTRLEGAFRVYNFEVAGSHTYFVSHAALLVHNACSGRGRRGKKTTRDHIDQVADEFRQNNPGYRQVGGGTDPVTGRPIPEEYLPGLNGGRKGSSYPDLTFEGPDGSRIRINTVDANKSGVMTPREYNNFNRIFEQTGEPVIAIPKP